MPAPILASSVVLLMAAAGATQAQSVEFRIVERQGQVSIPFMVGATPTTDNVLNYSVQARVVGGTATQFLGTFQFDIVASGEPDSLGTLSKLLTSNADGTYAANTAQANNSTIGRGGLSAIYTYLAGIGANFNGLINTSAGSFTNTPGNQEIGLVTGFPAGNSLLLLTDLNLDGNPDTYPGTGTTAPVDPSIASEFLGASGNFVDVYRFKYTVSNTTTIRFITFGLANASAQIGTSLQFTNGVWGPVQANAPFVATTANPILTGIFPSPGAAGVFACAGLLWTRRRRAPNRDWPMGRR